MLKDPVAIQQCLNKLMPEPDQKIDFVVGIESRGFILGSLLAQRLGCGFVPIEKRVSFRGHPLVHDTP